MFEKQNIIFSFSVYIFLGGGGNLIRVVKKSKYISAVLPICSVVLTPGRRDFATLSLRFRNDVISYFIYVCISYIYMYMRLSDISYIYIYIKLSDISYVYIYIYILKYIYTYIYIIYIYQKQYIHYICSTSSNASSSFQFVMPFHPVWYYKNVLQNARTSLNRSEELQSMLKYAFGSVSQVRQSWRLTSAQHQHLHNRELCKHVGRQVGACGWPVHLSFSLF